MKTGLLLAKNDYSIVEVPVPDIRHNQLLVKVLSVGVCGSDRRIWDRTHFLNESTAWGEWTSGKHDHEASGIRITVNK